MDFTALFAPAAAWLDAHPAMVSWLMGWMAALCAGQLVKQLLPYQWETTSAKRAVQAVATLCGTLVAYVLWPASSLHSAVYALLCGMSAPTAYTLIKAVMETRWPNLAYRLSWSRVQDRKSPDVPASDDPCDHPECFRRKPEVGANNVTP